VPSKIQDFTLPAGCKKVDRQGLVLQNQENEKDMMLLLEPPYGSAKEKRH
jgi:hypothetical protein